MGKQIVFSRRQLKETIRDEVERLIDETTEAVNTAPDGRVISASEGPVREAVARFRQALYEKAIGLRAQAAKAAFSPSGRRGDGSAMDQQGDQGRRSSDE